MSREPNHTCPLIDEAIEQLENIRKANSDIREWGKEGWDQVSSLEDDISKLEDEVADLTTALQEANARIAELEAETA